MARTPVRTLVETLVGCALCALLAACSPPAPPLQVGTNHWAGYEGLYHARNLGVLDARQVKLLEFSSTQEALRAFRNGALDAVAVTLDEALLLARQQQLPRIVLVMDISDGGDVLMARPGIDRLEQLKGKRIGVETTTLGAYMLARLLAKSGLKATDVQVVHLPVDGHLEAYRDGRVDAVITFEPVRSLLLKAGAHELFSSRDIPGEIVDVLVVRQGLLQARRSSLCHLIDSYFVALDDLRQAPRRAATRLAGPEGITPEELVTAWGLMRLPDRSSSLSLLRDDRGGLLPVLGKLERLMWEGQLLDGMVDESQLLAPELLESCAR